MKNKNFESIIKEMGRDLSYVLCELGETRKTLNFVLDYGKDNVVVQTKDVSIWFKKSKKIYTFTYLHNNQVRVCETDIENLGKEIIIHLNKKDKFIFSVNDKFYQVDKGKATYVEIYEPLFVKENAKS